VRWEGCTVDHKSGVNHEDEDSGLLAAGMLAAPVAANAYTIIPIGNQINNGSFDTKSVGMDDQRNS